MSINKIEFEQLQETLYQETLSNGLDVYVLPKQGFQKAYATLTTKYGSIDDHFVNEHGQETKVPDGIAHFLEHKMFESEHGDVFAEFSKNGAQANAFTSFDRTAYLFSTTSKVKENVHTLLDFVQDPHFTEENVQKEKGIIEQEIKMYEDNADWRLHFGLIDAMYHNLPIKKDIAGTVESIYAITKDQLYTCYHTFYHPSNMLLFIVGAVDPQQMLELVREHQQKKSFKPVGDIKRFFAEEPATTSEQVREIHLDVSVPKCVLGFKEPRVGLQGRELMKQEMCSELLLDILVGPGSDIYTQLLEEGLTDESFGAEYSQEMYYGYTAIGGNTPNPDKLVMRIREQLAHAEQITEADMQRSRKKKIGSFLQALNSPEFIANQFTRYRFNEMDLFHVIPVLEELTYQDVLDRAKNHFEQEHSTVCIVK